METPPQPPQKRQKPIGPVAAVVIIVLIFILGGLYFFLKQEQKLHEEQLMNQEYNS
jgi:hypothetical protein